MTNCLNCICMKQCCMRMSNVSQFFNRLNCTDFVIYDHHRDQSRLLCNGPFKHFRSYCSACINRQINNGIAKAFQCTTSIEYRMMLNLRCNCQMLFPWLYNAFYSPVIAFCTTGGKKNLLRQGTNTVCNHRSCFCKSSFRLTRKSIRLRNIAIILQQEWLHCLKSINIQLCRCCVVCVDKMPHGSTSIVVLNIGYSVFPGNIELFRINDTKLLLDNCSHFLCGFKTILNELLRIDVFF